MKLKLANDFSGSQYLHAEGSFHVTVLEVDESPMMGQNPVDGFKVTFGIQAGTVDGSKGKQTNVVFGTPNPSESEGLQRLKERQQSRFLMAVGLVKPGMEGQEVEIDLRQAAQRQCVIDLEWTNSEKKYLRLKGVGVYHVDDPECSGVPKNAACLDVIPPGLRHKKDSADVKAKSSVKAAATKGDATKAAMAAEIDDL